MYRLISQQLALATLALFMAATLIPAVADAKKKKKEKAAPAEEAATEATTGPAPAAEALPAAADLFARNLEAIGGEEALRSHSKTFIDATMSLAKQGIEGTMKIYTEAPDKMKFVTEIAGIGTSTQGFDGTVGWSNDPMSGPAVLEGDALVDLRRGADYYMDANYAQRYKEMETVERIMYGAYDTYKVRLVTPEGKEEFNYFDVETGLAVGSESIQNTEMGPVPVQTMLLDFTEYGGLKMPTRVIEAMGTVAVEIKILSVTYDSADFPSMALPPEIQALVDEQAATP